MMALAFVLCNMDKVQAHLMLWFLAVQLPDVRTGNVRKCFLCTVLTAASMQVNMSVAVIPMAEELGWSATDRGLVSSAFFWGYALTQIPAGYLSTK